MSVLQNILSFVALKNVKLIYVETNSINYIFELKGFVLPKNIVDKNTNKILKEREAIIKLDINTQNIGSYDYTYNNYGRNVRFYLPKNNFPFQITEQDDITVTGTFQK